MIDVVIEQKKKNFVNTYVQDLDLSCKKKVVYQQQQQKNKLKNWTRYQLSSRGGVFICF